LTPSSFFISSESNGAFLIREKRRFFVLRGLIQWIITISGAITFTLKNRPQNSETQIHLPGAEPEK